MSVADRGYGPVETTRRPAGVFTEWGGGSPILTRAAMPAVEKLPEPLTVDAVVKNDVATRTLIVSSPENLSGYQRLWWRTAHGELVKAQESGWAGRVPFLFAHGAAQRDIAHGLPGDSLDLEFHFPVGKEAYRELVSQPGLRALVTIDKSRGWFMGVRFLHGRKG